MRQPPLVAGLGSPGALAAVAVALLAAIGLTWWLNGYFVYVLANVALLAICGIGLNILLGLTGQVSFGHAGFYALGAYVVAVLTGKGGMSFWLAWPVGIAISAALGLLLALPALRVKGPYLAMITIAFGFIVEHGIVEWRSLTGGQNGIMGIASPTLFGVALGERGIATLSIVACGVSLALYTWLSRGVWGAAMRAVKDSEPACESVGINPLVVKTVAFSLSAALAGMAGGLFAPMSGFVTPQAFGFLQSILFVLAVMIGGAGSVIGPLLGAVIVGVLPEALSSLEEYRLLFFGVLLLVVLWVAPMGLAGVLGKLWRRFVPLAAQPGLPAGGGGLPSGGTPRGALQVTGLGRVFGGVRAVHELSFETLPGGVTSLIGPNGAGKTTVLNMLSGFYQPSAGTFALEGQRMQGRAAWKMSRSGMARTYQTSQLFGTLSVEDNVALGVCGGKLGFLLGRQRLHAPGVRERCRALLAHCGYEGSPGAPAADLPHVDRRLVEIARALATSPRVLLLDEPAAGLSREDKSRLSQLLRAIAQSGIAVVVVEHDMALVMEVSDRIVVIDAGQLLAVGTPAGVRDNEAVRRAYLGDMAMAAPRARRDGPADTNAPELLGVNKLGASYGAVKVLSDVDLQVRRGQMVALLGANGAGKSTLMRALAGLHRPVSGGIHLAGEDLVALQAEQVVARGVVLVPEGRQVFPELSVLENLRLGAFLKPRGMEERTEQMLRRFPRLRERLHQRAGLLSGGEQQMLAIARGLMGLPEVLLLDEPSLGLAPKVIEELFAALDQLRDEEMTLVLVDQMAALALSLADHACVIEGGRVVSQGSAQALLEDGSLVKAYLGG
jgi:branched-chain amino acid transport system ATP-binding protein